MHMYPNNSYGYPGYPGGYPGYPPQYPNVPVYMPGYETTSSKLNSDQEDYDEYYEESENSKGGGFRRTPGPILDKMLEEFYLGDEMLKEERKKKASWWSLNKQKP